MLLNKKAGLLATVFTFVFSLIVPLAAAQQQDQNIGSGLQLSPTQQSLTGQPGESKTLSIILKNITQADLTAQVFLNDFSSDNDSGTPQIIVDTNERTPYTLANMIKNLNDVDLKAGETKEITQTVNIPINAAPGAYFGAIRYAAIPKGQDQTGAERQVSLTASVAHLVFVEVPGDINEQLQVESLKAQRNNGPGSFFFESPNQVAVKIKNKGNGLSRPFGKVNVKGPFGGEVYSYDINNTTPRSIILPDSSRKFTDEIKGVKLPGKYNLTASIAYGNGGEVVTYKSSFIYMPVWAIILILLLIGLIAIGIIYVYRKRYAKTIKRR